MERGVWKRVFVVMIFILLYATGIWAEEPLVIVTDPWPPYTVEIDGDIRGTDVEITQAVFRQLGIPVNIQFYPWKRCLMMVETQKADAILDASITPERQAFLYFPDEPVSEGITVFFIKKGRTIPFTALDDLNGLRVGAGLGYSYCDDIDQASFMEHAERVPTLEQNFKKLLADRLDVVVEVDAVGYFTAKQMGILDQITIIPHASYCQGGNYLAFSKKSGHDQLASQFSTALQAFKLTDEYTHILQTYGQDVK